VRDPEDQEEIGVLTQITGILGVYSDPDTSSPTPTARSARNGNSSCSAARSPAL